MHTLKKILKIIGDKQKKKYSLFEKHFIKAGKELSLFKGIINGVFQNDHSAAKSLYQASKGDKGYMALKIRLEDRLLNYLTFLELSEGSSKADISAEYRCEMQLYQAHMLIRQGEYQLSERLLKRALFIAREYEFTPVAVESLELLLDVYMKTGSELRFNQTKEDFVSFQEILTTERTAGLLYREAQLRLLANESIKEALPHVLETNLKLENLWKQAQSFTCFDFYYRLHVEQLQFEGKYGQLLVLTTLSDEFLRELKINKKRFNHQHNHLLQLYAALRSGDIANGLQLAMRGQALFESQSDNWLQYQEYYFLLALQAQDYTLATELANQAEQNLLLNKADSFIEEKWKLFRIYLHWIYPTTNSPVVLDEQFIKQMLPSFQKDKQGYKVAILILQFSYYLYNNERDILSKKADSYKKYAERHFVQDSLKRERIFFLLMVFIIRHNFQYELIIKRSARLVKQLNQCIITSDARVSAIEIVPYEHLWNRFMEVLYKLR